MCGLEENTVSRGESGPADTFIMYLLLRFSYDTKKCLLLNHLCKFILTNSAILLSNSQLINPSLTYLKYISDLTIVLNKHNHPEPHPDKNLGSAPFYREIYLKRQHVQ